jgi:ornithine cyclodeaminase
MRVLDAAATRAALSPSQATRAIRDALAAGLDPATDPERRSMPVPGGELLIMPSALPGAVGIKVLTVAEHGSPRIQGHYLLFDGNTLTPQLILDGAALTVVRTPAVSFAPFLPRLAELDEPVRVAIFGTGPQAHAHHATLGELLPPTTDLQVSYLSRTRPADPTDWLPTGSDAASDAVHNAQLIVCATTAREPILDLPELRSDVLIIAVGSHSPDARELGSALLAGADVIVEDPATALRECGDVVLAVADGALDPADLIPMREVVRGRALSGTRPTVFKTSGMSWEDLVVAQAIAASRPAQ